MKYNTKRLRVFEYEGYTILVGKSDVDNDYLTFEIAQKQNSMWFHVAGYSGSHVVLLLNDEADDYVHHTGAIEYACYLAHKYSKARNIKLVDVHHCMSDQVKKVSGSPDGQVQLGYFIKSKSYKNKYE